MTTPSRRDLFKTGASLAALGAKPVHVQRVLRQWTHALAHDQGRRNPEHWLPQAVRDALPAIAGSSAFSIAGGGDTLAAIAKYGIEKQVDYISTGGGAFLEVLEGKTLPAFEILQKRAAG